MMKGARTWVVVADARRARIYVSEGVGQGLREVPGGSFEVPKSSGQDVYADRSGRAFDSHGAGRHAMERPTSPEDQGRLHLVRDVVAWLAAPKNVRSYDRLALVAAPRTLGDLRGNLPDSLRDKVAGEVSKDLTKAGPEQIAEALGDQIFL
jgi:protein required for attachment to host cells